MVRKEVVEYCTRCSLLGIPCILDNYYEIEIKNNLITLKNLDFISLLDNSINDMYVKLPDYIEVISSYAVDTKGVIHKNFIHLDLNKVKYLDKYAFNACTNLKSIIGNEVEHMEYNSIVVYTDTPLYLCFEKIRFDDLGLFTIATNGTTVSVKCKDKETLVTGLESLNLFIRR